MKENQFKNLLKTHRDPLLFDPAQISFSLNSLSKQIKLQNLTLHFLSLRIISPNYSQIAIQQQRSPYDLVLAPCQLQQISVSLNFFYQSNFNSYKANSKLIVYCFDADEFESYTWENIPSNYIHRFDFALRYEDLDMPSKYRIIHNVPSNKLVNTSIIAQSLRPFNAQEKEEILIQCFKQYGETNNYTISSDIIIFNFEKLIIQSNDCFILIQEAQNLFVSVYKPHYIVIQIPKNNIEPISPQPQRKPKIILPPPNLNLKRRASIPEQSQQSEEIEQLTVRKVRAKSTISVPLLFQRDNLKEKKFVRYKKFIFQEIHTLPGNSLRRCKRFGKNLIGARNQAATCSLCAKQRVSQSYNYWMDRISQLEDYSLEEVCSMEVYSEVMDAVIFKDLHYLLTVSKAHVVSVWNLKIQGEVGQFHDISKLSIIKEWKYIEQTADEHYEFLQKDPEESKKRVYSKEETDHRFIVCDKGDQMKIYNIEQMKLEFTFNSRMEWSSCIEFMPFRGLFCIGGMPKISFFGSAKKYRSIRFYRMDTLQEKPKYKIFTHDDNEFMHEMVFSDNSEIDRKHLRISSILTVTMTHRNGKNVRLMSGGRVIFLFFDRMNKMTVLLAMDSVQLQIRGIEQVVYLPLTGKFAVVEMKVPGQSESQQKIIVLNLKHIQTLNGKQNGMECSECALNDNLQLSVVSHPPLMLLTDVENRVLVFQDIESRKEFLKHEIAVKSKIWRVITQSSHVLVVMQGLVKMYSVNQNL